MIKVGECYLDENIMRECIETLQYAAELTRGNAKSINITNDPKIKIQADLMAAKAMDMAADCFRKLNASAVPAHDTAPVVHARWIYTLVDNPALIHRVSYDGWMHCPVCLGVFRRIAGIQLFKYCPECGAKMDGESDDDSC